MRTHFVFVVAAIFLTMPCRPVAAQTPNSSSPSGPPPAAPGVFSADERAAIVAYWNAPRRYQTGAPPEAATKGPWQVRLTPDGSTWLLAYQRAVAGVGKIAPTTDAVPVGGENRDWETWVQAKLDHDRQKAQTVADAANAAVRATAVRATSVGQVASTAPVAPPETGSRPADAGVPPPSLSMPPPIPAALLAACGNPPPFAAAVTPLRHVVTFDDGDSYAYTDNVSLRPRYAYYRFPQGTVAYGQMLRDMPAGELNALFAAAGFSPSEQRIARAVSRLEGGFETVNTYDTGFVSVGFIQFVTLELGQASLCEVLAREKADHADDYARDFRRFGIEVNDGGVLTVVDPDTGAELVGGPAVLKVVGDKRLTAVFQRAGRRSTPFRVAQVQIARSHYWPADDAVKVTVQGRTLTGKVRDIVRSEAGLATLFDRKVNRGTIAPFAEIVTKIVSDHNLPTLADAAAYEREIIARLKYRADFLADKTLSQPK